MGQTLLIIFNLFILESLLSVDNAAVLAIMVKDLSAKDKPHALRYGILGAFLFRGVSLFFASILVSILWLKILGGLYLLRLVITHFTPKKDSLEEGIEAKDSKIYKFALNLGLNRLWATVLLVELMDMAFSIDNIFASVAMTSNIYLILAGVFMGIIAMRFVAQWFCNLISKYPSLETSAFIVIGLLSLKLIGFGIMDYVVKYNPAIGTNWTWSFLNSHAFDFTFSGAMMLIFFVPLLFKSKKATNYALQKG